MNRVAEQRARRRQLDEAAGAHHGDAVGDVVDDREVVADEQVGEAELLLQVLEQVEDLRLDRDVERGDRLVADHHVGTQRQRARDADALALAAREGVRVAAEMAAVEADQLEQLGDHLAAIGVVADAVDDQRLDQDVVDRHARIERAERVLEDELQLLAEARELLALDGHDVDLAAPVVEHHAAGALVGIGLDAAHQHLAERGLAAAGFAHEAQAFAAHDVEADVVDGADGAGRAAAQHRFEEGVGLADLEGLAEVADLEHRRVGIEGRQLVDLGLLLEEMARGGGDLADRLQALARRHVEARHGVQQRLEIGMGRLLEDVVQAAGLDDLAAVHDDDVVGDVGDHAEIVRDHQQRHAQFLLQVLHQAKDLGLDGDVERGGRLVRDQQRRPADQRHGDHRALAQAARQFERIGAQRAFGVGEADHAQHAFGQLVDLGAAHAAARMLGRLLHLLAQRMDVAEAGAGAAMQLDRLADLVAHGVERRQRGHRLLEDDRDLAAADGAHLGPGAVELGDVDRVAGLARVLEQDRAGRDARGTRQQAHDRLAADRLAGAGLAHQRERAAGRDRERDVVDGPQDAFVHSELDGEILDAQQILHTPSSQEPVCSDTEIPIDFRLALVARVSSTPFARAAAAARSTIS